VAAYLIAISPELQKSFGQKRTQELAAEGTRGKPMTIATVSMLEPPGADFDMVAAGETFEDLCTQCHGLKNLERSPPTSPEEVVDLVGRMVENGLEASEPELQQVVLYMVETYTR
jgi:hypothetical protein